MRLYGLRKNHGGKALASRTGRCFVDMDAYIVEQAGLSVTEIFDRFGEADFRRREREACRELARRSGCVIATGGGALTFPENTAGAGGGGAYRTAGCGAGSTAAEADGGRQPPAAGGTGPGA